MGRTTKQGIDFFSLDCAFDDKTEMYLIEMGGVGLGVLVALWQMIYSNEGYYIDDNKDLRLLIKKRIDVDINTIDACINTAIKREVFSSAKNEESGILTSKAIQKRYFFAAKRKKEVRVSRRFLLVDVYEYINNENVNIKEIDAVINAAKVKEKEKEKEKVNTQAKAVIDFNNFWIDWPKKVDKKDCLQEWEKMNDEKRQLAIDGAASFVTGKEIRYIKSPIRYLRKELWNDEVIPREENKRSNTGSNRSLSAVDRVKRATANDRETIIDITPHGYSMGQNG